jgi:hypothetical protein
MQASLVLINKVPRRETLAAPCILGSEQRYGPKQSKGINIVINAVNSGRRTTIIPDIYACVARCGVCLDLLCHTQESVNSV